MTQETPLYFAYYYIWKHPSSNNYIGSLMVVNSFGTPIEYVYSDKMKISDLQQLLYGDSLNGHLATNVIGIEILEKLENTPSFMFVNEESLLSFREKSPIPVLMIKKKDDSSVYDYIPNKDERGDVILFERLPQSAIQFDIYEPFNRLESASGNQFL